jgi:hypothetical protein
MIHLWNAACDLISETQNKTVCTQQLVVLPHSYNNLKCVFCDTAPLDICRQHLPCGNFPLLGNQHDKYACLWTVTFKDDLWKTTWKLTQWLKVESCLFIIRCRGMIAVARRREREQESNIKQEVCWNLVSQFWGLTVQAWVGRLSEWSSKHMCGCQWGSKQGVMIDWFLDFMYQCVFRMSRKFQKLNLFVLSSAQRVVMSPTICVQKNNPRSFTKPLLGWWCVILSDYFVCDEIQLLLQSSFQNTKTFRTGMLWPVNEWVMCDMWNPSQLLDPHPTRYSKW